MTSGLWTVCPCLSTKQQPTPMRKLYYTCLMNVKRLKIDGLVENVEALVVDNNNNNNTNEQTVLYLPYERETY